MSIPFRKAITISALCMIMLAGQIEYKEFYCHMMKQIIPESMFRQCMKNHALSIERGLTQVSNSSKMYSVIAKASIDRFDKSESQAKVSAAIFFIDANFFTHPTLKPVHQTSVIEGLSPPDISILTHDLRI